MLFMRASGSVELGTCAGRSEYTSRTPSSKEGISPSPAHPGMLFETTVSPNIPHSSSQGVQGKD